MVYAFPFFKKKKQTHSNETKHIVWPREQRWIKHKALSEEAAPT